MRPFESIPVMDDLKALALALKESSEIEAWCQLNYGRSLRVCVGRDGRVATKVEAYPMVELVPVFGTSGGGVEEIMSSFGMICGVHDDQLEPLVVEGLEILQGLVRISELYTLAQAVLSAVDWGDGYLDEGAVDFSDDAIYPFFLAGVSVRITQELLLGGNHS